MVEKTENPADGGGSIYTSQRWFPKINSDPQRQPQWLEGQALAQYIHVDTDEWFAEGKT